MKLNDYVKWTDNTRSKLNSSREDIIHMLFGMATELGELTDIFKKALAYKNDIDWINVEEEIGDIMYYIAGFCRINGIDLEQVIETNVEKLEARYPQKFNEHHANNRNLEKERGILERLKS